MNPRRGSTRLLIDTQTVTLESALDIRVVEQKAYYQYYALIEALIEAITEAFVSTQLYL